MTAAPPSLVQVALPVRVWGTFTYRVPEGMTIALGARVLVPFGKRKEVEGYAVGFPAATSLTKLKTVTAVLDDAPLVSEDMLAFTRWLHRYYRAPWGEVLAASVPPAARTHHGGGRDRKVVLAKDRQAAQEYLDGLSKRYAGQARVLEVLLGRESGEMWLRDLVTLCEVSYSPINTLAKNKLIRVEKERRTHRQGVPECPPADIELTPAQATSLEGINRAVASGDFSVFLLRGVTGSGKTEVYLRAIRQAVDSGRGAITLVPEISLTPQMVGRYLARFPDVAVLHSSLTGRERAAQWEAIRSGKSRVVVGARSAVFAPVPDLGLIVIDEEHEPSFKQDSSPRYHARDAAVVRARRENAVVVLGSATPSLESACNVRHRKYTGFVLPDRVKDLPMPVVEVIDLSIEAKEQRRLPIFSRRLEGHIRKTLDRGEQAILFLNRRGFSRILHCPSCGFRYECPSCRIALTYHQKINRAICHYCYHGQVPGKHCPACLSPGLKYQGLGTEKVEETASILFPGARLARMDSDSMVSGDDYEKIFHAVRNKEIDILVGTQMLAKGLDFPDVTLVGVILADGSLSLPDFRAAERTFQLITQVAGRAGRSDKGGRVVVQTFQPRHYAVRTAAAQDYRDFAEQELAFRRQLGYPPFGRLARLLVTGEKEPAVRGKARALAEGVKGSPEVTVLGPAPAPLAVIRNKFRYHLVLKAPSADAIQKALDRICDDVFRGSKNARAQIDVDPQSML